MKFETSWDPDTYGVMVVDDSAVIRGFITRWMEAVDGQLITADTILVAPGDFHMTVVQVGVHYQVKLNQKPPEHYIFQTRTGISRGLPEKYD